jgi:hypothetical protein
VTSCGQRRSGNCLAVTFIELPCTLSQGNYITLMTNNWHTCQSMTDGSSFFYLFLYISTTEHTLNDEPQNLNFLLSVAIHWNLICKIPTFLHCFMLLAFNGSQTASPYRESKCQYTCCRETARCVMWSVVCHRLTDPNRWLCYGKGHLNHL